MDPLSEVLRSVRLTGGIFLDARFTAPWCVMSKITPDDCRPFLSAPAQMIAYHFIISGRLLLSLDDEPPVEVHAGEIVVLPRNDAHILASGRGLPPVSADDLIQPCADGGLARISHGGGGPATHLVCGFLGSDDTHNPLIATLPRVMKLDVRQAASREWIEASVRFAASELVEGRFASSGTMSRLSELLFVEAVRGYASGIDAEMSGWLRGLKDPQVGRALALIHGSIAAPWSTERLAKEVALSRSAFVERFTWLVGMPPIRYLTFWRLQSAKLQLRETHRTIAQLAHAVGYESEEAFSRAFKREFGLPPARWRERDGG
jgi:AraC-like DNA-binding protein